jgi:two-component system sensor kinase FixL
VAPFFAAPVGVSDGIFRARQRDGYRVEAAGTVERALRARDWRRVSAIIVEHEFPGGAALLPRLKQLAPAVPVIVMTSTPGMDGSIVIMAMLDGINDYLLTPITSDALPALVRHLGDRSRAETRLAESEARHRALLNAIPDTMFRINREGTILDVQTHRDSALSTDAEHLVGSQIQQAPLPEEAIERLQRCIDRALRLGEVQCLEYEVVTSKGPRHYEARIVTGGEDEVVAIVRDTTLQKQAEERALQAERLAAIGQMVAGLAHESRNAFQRSQACLEMLALELEGQPESLELVSRIQKAQEHLHHLYEEVRHYAAPIHLQKQACDLAQIWRDTWAHLEFERREKDVRLYEEIRAVSLTCRADPDALEQLFRNILENAIVACPEPGTIMIRCARAELQGQDAICISIRDNGPGFQPETRAKAFDPFFTTKTKGTGLGLAIALRIAEAHAARIEVGESSEPGGELIVTLPYA